MCRRRDLLRPQNVLLHTLPVVDNIAAARKVWLRFAALMHAIASATKRFHEVSAGQSRHDGSARAAGAHLPSIEAAEKEKSMWRPLVRLHHRPMALVPRR